MAEDMDMPSGARVSRRVLAGMRLAFGQSPMVVATEHDLEFGDHWAMLPAALVCWALG